MKPISALRHSSLLVKRNGIFNFTAALRKHAVRAILPMAAAGLLSASPVQAALTCTGDVSPDPSLWVQTNPVTWGNIGNTSDGSLVLDGGSTLTSNRVRLGYSAGVSGTATVTGTGTTWNVDSLRIGWSGNGTLNITGGGSVNTVLYVGDRTTGNGTVTVSGSGSKLTGLNPLYIGFGGTGVIKVINGGAVSGDAIVGNSAGSMGTVIVNGAGSTWTGNSGSIVSQNGSSLIITDGGTYTARYVTLNTGASLTVDLGRGSSLNSSTGLANNGTIRLVAGAGTGADIYTPISLPSAPVPGGAPVVWQGTGSVQALGGVWNQKNYTVTVSSAAAGAAGSALTIDLSTTQRFLFTDGSTGKTVGASFQATTSPSHLTMTASAISGSELTSLHGLLGTGQAVLSGWDFSATEGYTTGNPVYLSLFAGSGHSLSDLTVWQYDGSTWSKYTAYDLAYDKTCASFTATGLNGYAVTGAAPVPVPPAVFLFGSGLSGLFFLRRKKFQA